MLHRTLRRVLPRCSAPLERVLHKGTLRRFLSGQRISLRSRPLRYATANLGRRVPPEAVKPLTLSSWALGSAFSLFPFSLSLSRAERAKPASAPAAAALRQTQTFSRRTERLRGGTLNHPPSARLAGARTRASRACHRQLAFAAKARASDATASLAPQTFSFLLLSFQA